MRSDGVYHLTAEGLLMETPTESVDLIVTSPPYDGMKKYKGNSRFNFLIIARNAYRVLKQGGVMVWVVGDETVNGSESLSSFRQAIHFKDVCGFNIETMIYEKDSFSYPSKNRYAQVFEYMFVLSKGAPKTVNLLTRPSKWAGHSHSVVRRDEDGNVLSRRSRKVNATTPLNNVWRIPTGKNKTTTDDVKHPAMFPEELAERHILTWSNPGDLVLDFFSGSGTTLKMAKIHGRHFIGCDISSEYVEESKRRLASVEALDGTRS